MYVAGVCSLVKKENLVTAAVLWLSLHLALYCALMSRMGIVSRYNAGYACSVSCLFGGRTGYVSGVCSLCSSNKQDFGFESANLTKALQGHPEIIYHSRYCLVFN